MMIQTSYMYNNNYGFMQLLLFYFNSKLKFSNKKTNFIPKLFSHHTDRNATQIGSSFEKPLLRSCRPDISIS